MARRTGRGGFQFRHGKGRLTQWVGPPAQAFVSVASAGATLIDSFAPEEALTVIRNRGAISHTPEGFAADIEYVGAFGVGIVSAEAFAAGIASVPTPFTDADWAGWMVWRSFAYRYEFLDGTGSLLTVDTIEIDSKAMRKIGPNEVLAYVAESQIGAFRLMDGIRTLVKLS